MKSTFRIILFLVFLVSSVSCQKEDNTAELLANTWQQSFKTVNGEEELNEYSGQKYMQIASNGIVLIYSPEQGGILRSGWSYSGNMLNISLNLPAAFYIEKVTREELILKRLDFSSDGELITTITGWKGVPSADFPSDK